MLTDVIKTFSDEGTVNNTTVTPDEGKNVDVNPQNTSQDIQQPTGKPEEGVQSTTSEPQVTPKRLEEMQPQELIGELKKWQRIAEERKVLLEKNQSAAPEFQEFLNKAKTDFWGAYREYQDKLGLPHYEFVQAQTKFGDIESQMEAYQNNVLVPEIMEKFGLDEFEFDPSEAWIPKTPSFYFREKMEEYHKQLKSKYENEVKQAEEMMSKIEAQKQKDIEFLKQTYFDGNDEEFNQLFEEFNHPSDPSVLTDVENHILSLRNIFRGYYFDKLVERIVKREVDKVHAQYAKLGIKLPKTDIPIDASSVKTGASVPTEPPDAASRISPLRRVISKQLS